VAGRQRGVPEALLAAVLFGGATPFSSRLIGDASPQVLAGLLYLGSGLVLGLSLIVLPARRQAPLTRRELPSLAGAVAFGGFLAPLLLLIGLRTTPAATASLLLNLEVVFTALVAWVAFHEGFNRQVGIGLGLILAGGVVASWSAQGGLGVTAGAVAVVGACACWAIDNNLTQQVSAKDPRQIAAVKGIVAGGANLGIGVSIGGSLPDTGPLLSAVAIGVVGYGVSLMLFITALRFLGSARTGAYFAVAPFVGVVVAIGVFGDQFNGRVVPAAVLMVAGVWLSITEHHEHAHIHDTIEHSHVHTHDDEHAHSHADEMPPSEPHVHAHVHDAITHAHSHRPDIHHRHAHRSRRDPSVN
jgi:drug/metabolite transporter (DMT)-like permease